MPPRTIPRDEHQFVVPWQLPPEAKERVIDLTNPAASVPTETRRKSAVQTDDVVICALPVIVDRARRL